MIYALSLSPCMDRTVTLDRFSLTSVNRVTRLRMDLAGKGINVARVVETLGEKCVLVSLDFDQNPVAQGMKREGIPCRAVLTPGEIRINTKYMETATGRMIEANENSAPVPPAIIEQTKELLLSLVRPGDWVSLSGSLPTGAALDTYADLCEKLREKGAFAAVDCDGYPLRSAISKLPALLKPNAHEFFEWTGIDPMQDMDKALEECRGLVRDGVGRICLSLGEKGAALIGREGAYGCGIADVPVRGLQGAGDSMLGALLVALSRSMPDEEALRFSTAAAGASVMRPGTLLCEREATERLLPTIRAEKLGW